MTGARLNVGGMLESTHRQHIVTGINIMRGSTKATGCSITLWRLKDEMFLRQIYIGNRTFIDNYLCHNRFIGTTFILQFLITTSEMLQRHRFGQLIYKIPEQLQTIKG